MKGSLRRDRVDPPGARRAGDRRRRRNRAGARHPRPFQALERADCCFRNGHRAQARAGQAPSRSRRSALAESLPVEGQLPSLDGLGPWINSPPLTREQLKGKVVLIDFWTYSCINCIRSIPYVRAWYETLQGRRPGRDRRPRAGVRVRAQSRQCPQGGRRPRHQISGRARQRPHRVDRAQEQLLARPLLLRCAGAQRYHHFGEGDYDTSEMVIRQLLAEAGRAPKAGGMAQGDHAAAPRRPQQSEASARPRPTSAMAAPTASSRPADRRAMRRKAMPLPRLQLNDWALEGNWTVGRQSGRLELGRRRDRLSLPRPRPSPGAGLATESRCVSG